MRAYASHGRSCIVGTDTTQVRCTRGLSEEVMSANELYTASSELHTCPPPMMTR